MVEPCSAFVLFPLEQDSSATGLQMSGVWMRPSG